jgi:peptidoglycan hydrolase-like protein with peptidoglycan-binding domain
MREVLDDEGRGQRPLSMLALAVTATIGIAVTYNAMFAQPNGDRLPLAAGNEQVGATTRVAVTANSDASQTILLKYDPVVEEVQRQLLAAGYYKGIVDGVAGRHTRQAIEAYQQESGITVTGEATPELAEHIRYTREVAEAALFTGSVDASPDPLADQRAAIRRVQTGLAELAYSPGPISGEMNGETEQAIRQFEHDRGLAETGQISDALMTELAKLSGQSGMTAN